MILYVVRHAQAIEMDETFPDIWRFLTHKGKASVKKMRSDIIKYGPKPKLIITSPLVRAVQTAEILAEKILKINTIIVSGFLQPGTDIKQLIAYIKKHKSTTIMMIVGHEPQLGSLVSKLLNQTDKTITIKKGACVALKIKLGRNKKTNFLWYLSPGNKAITSHKKFF